MVGENHPVMEGILELTLNILIDELMVLGETIVDFKNLKDGGFDFSDFGIPMVEGIFQKVNWSCISSACEAVLDTCHCYKDTITSFVMNRNIIFTEKSIVDLISYNGCGKMAYNVKTDTRREAMVAFVIFKE